jgi:hypothetical protein
MARSVSDSRDTVNETNGVFDNISAPNAEKIGSEARTIDPELEKRVLHKIDLFLMPAMVLGTQTLNPNPNIIN